MALVEFYYCNKEYYFKDILIYTGTTHLDNKGEEKIKEFFLKCCRSKNYLLMEKYWKLTDEELLKDMNVKALPKPTTFPKFSNENPFKVLHFKSYNYNPKIIAIRWSGYEWEYQLENIGHKTDYQSESRLISVE